MRRRGRGRRHIYPNRKSEHGIIYLGRNNPLYYLLGTRQRRQAQFNRAQRRHIILHHQRHIIIQIHLDLITQIRTFDEIPEIF